MRDVGILRDPVLKKSLIGGPVSHDHAAGPVVRVSHGRWREPEAPTVHPWRAESSDAPPPPARQTIFQYTSETAFERPMIEVLTGYILPIETKRV
ncbi:MAG: hypothetical protein AAF636_13625 [Pseudomonadota bacterium]